ncbi:hypothetical protein PAXRUDRAFT_766405, partial [Paxillus rubicundulus Ve08.2h10]
ILVNPTGKGKKWHAVDWCVELNNLFTKAPIQHFQQAKNGGKGSNHTVERIILKSPLVQMYRNIQTLIQKNFDHTHLSTKYRDADMAKSFKKLCSQLAAHLLHSTLPGRKSRHTVIYLFDKGREMMEKAAKGEGLGDDKEGDEQDG